MSQMDQARLTVEELAFCQRLSVDAELLAEYGDDEGRDVGDDYAQALRIIRRLAGDKP